LPVAATSPVTPFALGLGVQIAMLRLRRHPLGEKRFELVGPPVEHADFDDFVFEHFMNRLAEIYFQELDALFDGHFFELFRVEAGEGGAGGVQGVEFLLLQDAGRDVADLDDVSAFTAFAGRSGARCDSR